MKKYCFIIAFALFINPVIIFCASGTGLFLQDIYSGARFKSIGEANASAMSADYYNNYNPASHAGISTKIISLTQYILPNDRYYTGLGFAIPVRKNIDALTFELQNITIADIHNYDINDNYISDFSSSSYMININYSIGFKDKYFIGYKFRYMLGKISSYNSFGLSNDFGFITTVTDDLKTGVLLKNIGSYLIWDSARKETGLPIISIGAEYSFMSNKLIINADIDKILTNNDFSLKIGAEYKLIENVLLRAGYNQSGIKLGFGLRYDIFSADYSFGLDKYTTAGEHFLTLETRLN